MLTEKLQTCKIASHYAERTSNKSRVVEFHTKRQLYPLYSPYGISLYHYVDLALKLAARALLLVDKQLTDQQKPLGSTDQT